MRFPFWSYAFIAQYSFRTISQAASNTTNTTAVLALNNYPDGGLNATAWSLIYTYPLAIFASWAGGVLRNVSVNEIYHQRILATPNDPGVIKPNIDTLYSRVVLDLPKHDVVLTIPNITDRYYLYPIYDPYGNIIADIGIVNGNKPGKYLIRRAEDVATQPGFTNSSRTSNSTCKYEGIVDFPTTYGTILIRILLLHNTTTDLNLIHAYQNASHLQEINRTTPPWQSSHAPTLKSTALNNTLLGISTPAQQLEFAARIFLYNQPENYTDRVRVSGILARARLYNSHFHPQPSINLTQAALVANASITSLVEAPENIRDEGNGWQLQTPSNQGNYGLNYASAAYVALFEYQQLPTRQALYPRYKSLGFTSAFSLAPKQSLLVTFSGKPQLKEYGFWSLSVYRENQYLIPNALDRYSVSDRTEGLTYEYGQVIYGTGANTSRDDAFHILVQDVNTPPAGSNWTSNWLPVEPNFTWILRWYVPQDTMTNGSYVYPFLQNITAITA